MRWITHGEDTITSQPGHFLCEGENADDIVTISLFDFLNDVIPIYMTDDLLATCT